MCRISQGLPRSGRAGRPLSHRHHDWNQSELGRSVSVKHLRIRPFTQRSLACCFLGAMRPCLVLSLVAAAATVRPVTAAPAVGPCLPMPPPPRCSDSGPGQGAERSLCIDLQSNDPTAPLKNARLDNGSPSSLADTNFSDCHGSPSDCDNATLTAHLSLPQSDVSYKLHLSWDGDVHETVPIFVASTVSGNQWIRNIPLSETWRPTISDIARLERDLPMDRAGYFKYYFAGRQIFAKAADKDRNAPLGIRALRDWFVGSFNLSKTECLIGVDGELVARLSDLIVEANVSPTLNEWLLKWLLQKNATLLGQYLDFPSGKLLSASVPDEVRRRFSAR
jgi:hypothetical protein